MVRNFLQGRPFGHPIHTAIIHFPIGLFVLSVLFDLSTHIINPSTPLVTGSYYALGIAILAALLAAITGFADWLDIRMDHPGKGMANLHMFLNLIAVILFATSWVLRIDHLEIEQTPVAAMLISIAGLGLLSVSGYLGGRLVYEQGISVGRHRRKTDTPKVTLQLSQTEAQDGLIGIVTIDEIGEKEILRAELDGNVMAIARIGDQFWAFQEFCTHRFGPLSEGTIHDFEVKCPWHQSCFDIRTGEVTQGPAKIELNTYPLVVKEGRLYFDAKRFGESNAVELTDSKD
jgi:uncharacterized membrane protein/nitrite reductase/ring-hydroxylating ferredoxin subunit